jgi:hypothetical protein
MPKYVVLPNSPIEFAVTGPYGGKDKLLVRSDNAGLDLIGLAAQFDLDSPTRGHVDLLSRIFGNTRQPNLVSSLLSPDISPESDARHSRFNFAWKGYASASDVKHAEQSFNLILPDLHRVLRNGDDEEVELIVAPLIYHCIEASERRLRSRRFMLATLAIYFGIMALVWSMMHQSGR